MKVMFSTVYRALKGKIKARPEVEEKLSRVIEQDVKGILEMAKQQANANKRKMITAEDLAAGVKDYRARYILDFISEIQSKVDATLEGIRVGVSAKYEQRRDSSQGTAAVAEKQKD